MVTDCYDCRSEGYAVRFCAKHATTQEMLEALKHVAAWIDRTFTKDVRDRLPEWYIARETIRAAIAKAEGSK